MSGIVKTVSMRYDLIVAERDPYELLERIGTLIRASERAAGQATGLQPVQLHALSYLARCNRYSDTPRAVTEYLGVTKGTASQTLRRLQDRGLIGSRPDAEDGRVVRLSVTAKGRRTLGRISPPPEIREALDDLADPAALADALAEALRSIVRSTDARSFGVCSTCRYHERSRSGSRCGLIGEPLSAADGERICREHEAA